MDYYRRHFVTMICVVLLTGCGTAAPPTIVPTNEPPPPAEPTQAPAATVAPTAENVHFFGGSRIVGTTPAVPKSTSPGWDFGATSPGGMVFDGTTYYLFRKGFRSLEGPDIGATGYSTSTDGLTWTPHAEPVITETDPAFDPPGAMPSSALIEPDGTWVLYVWAPDPTLDHATAIWRMTSPGADGPWIVDPKQPVLTHGETGAWDDGGVYTPSVAKMGDTYFMLFGGYVDAAMSNQIGMATSTDGISWEKHDGPVVMPEPANSWESTSVQDPHVVEANGELVLLYSGWDDQPGNVRLGLAHSPDGITWERFDANPVLTIEDIPGRGLLHQSGFYHVGSTYFLFAEVVRANASNIWLSVFEGDIDW